MTKKKTKSIEELKKKETEQNTITNVIQGLKERGSIVDDTPKKEEKEERDLFTEKVEAISLVINSLEGKKLALKLKVVNNTGFIFQGLFSNVWGRVHPNGDHVIYRHALTNLLKKHNLTKRYFT